MVKNMKKIENYENYLISEDGKVFNYKKSKYMSVYIDMYGYPTVTLHDGNKKKTFRVHRLVASAYIINSENLKTVNHKDGVKTNNNVSNLEWMSDRDNQLHAYKTGLRVVTEKQRKSASENAKLRIGAKSHHKRRVINNKTGEIFETMRSAAKYLGITEGCLYHRLKGDVKNNTGFSYL